MTAAVKRRAAPVPRRRYRSYALSRSVTFAPGFIVPLGGWLYLDEPLHWAGLLAMAAAGLFVIPVAVLWVVFCLPAMLMGGLVPRRLRIRHRRKHGRERCKSAVITTGLRRVTSAMDRNRCLYCGITAAELALLPPRIGKDGRLYARRLHVDHYRPWIAGFLTTLFNMSLLCDEHNEMKSSYYRERNGYVWYHRGSRSPQRLALAAEITRTIRWRRWSPFRLWRAAWALG
jgi:hypothetical protein